MSSSRPYLIRALYEWIVDNEFTPYILVDATTPGAEVPTQHVRDGQLVLNISPRAVEGLSLSNEGVSFSARFGGEPQMVVVPPRAVLAIYARENGEGMVFRDDADSGPRGPDGSPTLPKSGKPSLKVVK